MVLLERKGVSGWISKCSLVKSDGVPQGTYVHMYVYVLTCLQYVNSRYETVFGTFVCMYICSTCAVLVSDLQSLLTSI